MNYMKYKDYKLVSMYLYSRTSMCVGICITMISYVHCIDVYVQVDQLRGVFLRVCVVTCVYVCVCVRVHATAKVYIYSHKTC